MTTVTPLAVVHGLSTALGAASTGAAVATERPTVHSATTSTHAAVTCAARWLTVAESRDVRSVWGIGLVSGGARRDDPDRSRWTTPVRATPPGAIELASRDPRRSVSASPRSGVPARRPGVRASNGCGTAPDSNRFPPSEGMLLALEGTFDGSSGPLGATQRRQPGGRPVDGRWTAATGEGWPTGRWAASKRTSPSWGKPVKVRRCPAAVSPSRVIDRGEPEYP